LLLLLAPGAAVDARQTTTTVMTMIKNNSKNLTHTGPAKEFNTKQHKRGVGEKKAIHKTIFCVLSSLGVCVVKLVVNGDE
jgi:hypothetical protein